MSHYETKRSVLFNNPGFQPCSREESVLAYCLAYGAGRPLGTLYCVCEADAGICI